MLTVQTAAEVAPLLEHGTWDAGTKARARVDLDRHGYVFVSTDGQFVPHPSPAFVPEDYPERVMAWARLQ